MKEAASPGRKGGARPLTPRVSVIVPVKNRRELLRVLLEALDVQTFTDFEVIVVDGGSTDGTAEEAEGAVVAGRAVRLVHGGGGAARQRCQGVDQSQAEILAFTDSDCAPVPGWLEAGVAAIDRGAPMVNGLTVPSRPVAPLERSVASGEEDLFPTCNIFYRRSIYDEFGGFEPGVSDRWGYGLASGAVAMGFGEDVLLGWMVKRRYGATYEPAALVKHHVFEADLREWVRRGVMSGSFPGMIKEIPELRSSVLRTPILFDQFSRAGFYAFAVAVLSRRRSAVAAAGAAWVGLVLRDLRGSAGTRSQKLRAVPAKMLLDAVNAGALLVGDVKHGVLVL